MHEYVRPQLLQRTRGGFDLLSSGRKYDFVPRNRKHTEAEYYCVLNLWQYILRESFLSRESNVVVSNVHKHWTVSIYCTSLVLVIILTCTVRNTAAYARAQSFSRVLHNGYTRVINYTEFPDYQSKKCVRICRRESVPWHRDMFSINTATGTVSKYVQTQQNSRNKMFHSCEEVTGNRQFVFFLLPSLDADYRQYTVIWTLRSDRFKKLSPDVSINWVWLHFFTVFIFHVIT